MPTINTSVPSDNVSFSLDHYQSLAHSTCKESCDNPDYPTHEILEESVELYDKFFYDLPESLRDQFIEIHTSAVALGKLAKERAKAVRHNTIPVVIQYSGDEAQRIEKAYELGDILWGVAELARQYGFSLSQIAMMNVNKLASRQQRNQIEGDGDHR